MRTTTISEETLDRICRAADSGGYSDVATSWVSEEFTPVEDQPERGWLVADNYYAITVFAVNNGVITRVETPDDHI